MGQSITGGSFSKNTPTGFFTEGAVLPGCNKQPHDLHRQAILASLSVRKPKRLISGRSGLYLCVFKNIPHVTDPPNVVEEACFRYHIDTTKKFNRGVNYML